MCSKWVWACAVYRAIEVGLRMSKVSSEVFVVGICGEGIVLPLLAKISHVVSAKSVSLFVWRRRKAAIKILSISIGLCVRVF